MFAVIRLTWRLLFSDFKWIYGIGSDLICG